MSIAADRISSLQSELASLKRQRKEEEHRAKVESKWISVKKRTPHGDTQRVLAWANNQIEHCWWNEGKWYVYDGTFFLTEKDRIDNVSYWMAWDWMTSRFWPAYGPGIKNRVRYYWRRLTQGAQDMAHDLRPKGWGGNAQLSKKPTFFQDAQGRLMTGLPENFPAPAGFQKIVCNSASEAERYSAIQRRQEQYEHSKSMHEREQIEGAIHDQILSDRRTLIANARNSLNRDFLLAANERSAKQPKPWKYERESYLHAEGYEEKR